PDGSLDNAFGGTGRVYPPSPPGLPSLEPRDLTIDNQNRIVLLAINQDQDPGNHVLYRFNFDGSPDLTFSGTGWFVVPIPSTYTLPGIAIQPDNKVVAVTGAVNPVSGRLEWLVYRVHEGGGFDPSFGADGLVFTQMTPGIDAYDAAIGVAIQPDSKIVVSGRASSSGMNFRYALARYSATGELDADFGTGGKVIFPILNDNLGRKLVIQPDGKILITGLVCDTRGYLGAARVDERGVRDSSFEG